LTREARTFVSPERDEAALLRDDPGRREDLRGRLDRYLNVPLALEPRC
jgi:hypothetical protein